MGASKKPNLFIIGAMKSGTTSLHHYLGAHPEIFMCEPKEPGYFVEELALQKGEQWYLSLFSQARDEPILGESSTHYTKLPAYKGVPERIARFNEDARFIYVMRDPVERAISHYWHNVRNLRWEAERRDMLTAMRRDPHYEAFSDYASQLDPYLRLFGRDRVYAMTFEHLVAEPRAAAQAVLRWLGVDHTHVPPVLDQRWNGAPSRMMRVRGLGVLNRLRHSSLWTALSPWVPAGVRALGNTLAQRPVCPDSERTEKAISYLRPRLQERALALRSMLGSDFPEWTSLWGTGNRSPGNTHPQTTNGSISAPSADPVSPGWRREARIHRSKGCAE